MSGVVTTRHLFLNAPAMITAFGLGSYLRCLSAALSRRRVTFLDLVVRL